MSGYLVPKGFGEAEFIEKRSRFIGRVWRVESEDEAIAHIKEMREKHWDATFMRILYGTAAPCDILMTASRAARPACRRLRFSGRQRYLMSAAL